MATGCRAGDKIDGHNLSHLQTDKLCIELLEEQFPSLGRSGNVWKEATGLVVSDKLDPSNLIDVRSCS